MQATLDRMARPKKPPTESVRIDAELAKKARMVAANSSESLPDYLARVLRVVVDRDFQAIMQQYSKSPGRKKPE